MNTWDEAKRERTIEDRGLDFADAADAAKVFAGRTITVPDDRLPYGEERNITAGWLGNRFVIVVWTPRDGGRRIISMRYGHADEEAYCQEEMDRSR